MPDRNLVAWAILGAFLGFALGGTVVWAEYDSSWFRPLIEGAKEFSVAISTLVLTFVTYFLVSRTGDLWKAGEKQIRTTTENFATEVRPWTIATIESGGPLVQSHGLDGGHEARFGYQYAVKNIGKSPAMGIAIRSVVYFEREAPNVETAYRAFYDECQQALARKAMPLGSTLFPTDSFTVNNEFKITTEHIRDVLGDRNPDKKRTLYLFSVVQYAAPVSKTWHQTAYVHKIVNSFMPWGAFDVRTIEEALAGRVSVALTPIVFESLPGETIAD